MLVVPRVVRRSGEGSADGGWRGDAAIAVLVGVATVVGFRLLAPVVLAPLAPEPASPDA